MKQLFLIMFLLLIMTLASSCDLGRNSVTVTNFQSCTVSRAQGLTTIACPDGTQVNIRDGVNGANGHSASFKINVADVSVCANGGSVILMGPDLNDDGILQSSETSQIATVCNGVNGANGQDAAPTPFTPVGIVNPCGDAPGIDDEVFLRLANGSLLWSESDSVGGTNTRLAVARAGTWQTTDNDQCFFTLDSNFNITYESKHY